MKIKVFRVGEFGRIVFCRTFAVKRFFLLAQKVFFATRARRQRFKKREKEVFLPLRRQGMKVLEEEKRNLGTVGGDIR
jgi:hypothetical protein